MEFTEEIKNLVSQAKNICVIPNEEPESLTAALALFYSLKELGKNVNVVADEFPKNLQFLIPSLNFISQPKNFVISIPRNVADVSQVYYEKNEEHLKIHLTIDKGTIKKDVISFYFSDAKPDVIITLGIADFKKELEHKLDSFGFLLDAPIINIDNHLENIKFGKLNIIEEKSLSEMLLEILVAVGENSITQNSANCLLAGLLIYYDNFKNTKSSWQIFQTASELVKRGANNQQIVNNLYRNNQETKFLGTILQNLQTHPHHNTSFALLESHEFEDMTESQVGVAVEKIKTLGMPSDVLVLWKSHNSAPAIKGFFYSKKTENLNKIISGLQGAVKNDWAFISLTGENIEIAKDHIFNQLNKVF